MLCSEPTAHSSIKIWSFPHVRHSHSCSKLPCSELQHLKEDSQRYSGSVTLEIQKLAFILMGLEKPTRHRQKTGVTHLWSLGIVAMTDTHRHP